MDIDIKMMVVFSKLSYQFMNKLGKDLETRGMPTSTYTILAHLDKVDKAKTQSLGEVAVITSGTITHVVNKLEKAGYVFKVKDEKDRRITWVKITKAGKEAFYKVHEKHINYLNNMLSVFSDEEKTTFTEQLKYFGKTLQKRGETDEVK